MVYNVEQCEELKRLPDLPTVEHGLSIDCGGAVCLEPPTQFLAGDSKFLIYFVARQSEPYAIVD